MNTQTLPRLRTGLLLLGMIIALCFAAVHPQAAYASVLPGTTCTAVGTVRTCDLWATTGTLTLPAGSVPASVTIWGYASDGLSPAGLPGPTLIAEAGETLEINLTNNLSEATSLSIHGLSGPSDTSGVAPAGVKTYTYTGLEPGTYLYEAGPTANGERQVAMGMYGVLIVRPVGAPLQAYGPASTFNDEAVLVTSEIDPALNAAPAGFDLRNFAPKYFLFNGKAYPDTTAIDTVAGNTVLLRLVNAGLENHSVGVLGLRYKVLSIDAKPLAQPHTAVAETLSAGQTADVLVSIPALAPANMKYAVYDSNLRLLNNGLGFGGMLTFLTIPAGAPGSDVTGPSASGLALTPNPTDGSVSVALDAALSDVASGGSNVAAAEYFIDTTGAGGTGTAMSGTFGSTTANASATLSTGLLGSLSSGNHNIYVHGQDSAGNWGSFNFIVLNLDKQGPPTNSLQATPNISMGNVNVVLSGSANDSTTGNSNIQAAEYFIDASGADGSGTSMTVNQTAPVASVTATLSAATVNGLSEGNHLAFVHSQDAFGNWGAFSSVQFSVDKTGPAASIVNLRPNPNNGALAYSPSFQSVRLDASFSEPGAGPITGTVANAEFFIDTVGANGTGVLMTPNDGSFNGATESGYTYIPLITVNALAEGNHIISVHARDAAGNWGPFVTTTLVIDKTTPTVASIVRAAADPTDAASVNFTVTFSEPVISVDGFDFSLTTTGTIAGASVTSVAGANGTATRTVVVNTGTGTGTIRLDLIDNDTIRDVAGNRLGGTGLSNGNFITGENYTIDKPSVVSIVRLSTNPTSATSVNFRVTFSESVTGVDGTDFSVTNAGTTVSGASIISVGGTGTTRTVRVNTGTGSGTLRLDLIDNDTIVDTTGKRLGGAGAGNGTFTTGQSFTVDKVPPTVVSIVRAFANPTSAAAVNFTVTFSESVIGVDRFDFSVSNAGTTVVGPSVISVSGTGLTRTVRVNTGTGTGTLRLDLIDNDTIRDTATNRLGGTGAGNGTFTTGQSYNVR